MSRKERSSTLTLSNVAVLGWGESSLDDKKDLNRPGILQEKSPNGKLPKHLRTEWQRKPSKDDPDVSQTNLPPSFLALFGSRLTESLRASFG